LADAKLHSFISSSKIQFKMKKLFFLFAFMGLFAFGATAQKKACCAAKAAGEKTSCSAASMTDADKAAAADASIVKQVSNTGEVSYSRKEVCPTTGKVSLTNVEYCTKSAKFINMSPSDVKAACTKSASATKVSSTEKKASCAAGEKAGCCAKKGEKASTTSTENEGKVKLVSSETGSN
jgi:hypothetical protein